MTPLSPRASAMAFSFVAWSIGLGLLAFAGFRFMIPSGAGLARVVLAGGGVVAMSAIAAWLSSRAKPDHGAADGIVRITTEAPTEAIVEDVRGAAERQGYRGRAPRAPRRGPRTPARRMSMIVAACLGFTALAVPLGMHLPRWVEAEIVLGGWWALWAVVLGVLSHRGHPLDETLALDVRAPWGRRGGADDARLAEELPSPGRIRWYDFLDVPDFEGCAVVLGLLLVAGVALVGAFLIVELAAPVLFFLSYLGLATALRRADEASHRGNVVQSAVHGLVWATVYVAPLAAAVGVAHLALGLRGP